MLRVKSQWLTPSAQCLVSLIINLINCQKDRPARVSYRGAVTLLWKDVEFRLLVLEGGSGSDALRAQSAITATVWVRCTSASFFLSVG